MSARIVEASATELLGAISQPPATEWPEAISLASATELLGAIS